MPFLRNRVLPPFKPAVYDEADGDDRLESSYHSCDVHEKCRSLRKERGGCLCRQLLLFGCYTKPVVSAETWEAYLGSLLKDIPHTLWGCESEFRLDKMRTEGIVEHVNISVILIRVDNSEDRKRIEDILEWNSPLRQEDRQRNRNDALFLCGTWARKCCLIDFFYCFLNQQRDVSEITFGKESLHREILDIYESCLLPEALA